MKDLLRFRKHDNIEYMLIYRLETTAGAKETFATRVKLEGDRLILLLEEIDHLLYDVSCTAEFMLIKFREHNSYEHAKRACKDLPGGLIVASHASCSEDGAHSVFEYIFSP
jgi:hypothetical protein